MPETPADAVPAFLARWEASGAAERANYALFLAELCDVLGVPHPEPTGPDDTENAYVFERSVTFRNPDGSTSVGRIDLYKRGCFVLEAKQGSDLTEADPLAAAKRTRRGTAIRGSAGWDAAMVRARGQAEQYVRNLPTSEPNPPFLVVIDVGHTIELYSDFTGQGRTYVPFPEAGSHRLRLRDLTDEAIRDRLRLVWSDPMSLDPSRRAARVTRSVAERLAKLAQSFEASGHDPGEAAAFLMRCLFTFFAEDVGLLPRACFTDLLRGLRNRHETGIFPGMVGDLWGTMKTGGFSPILRQNVLRFNGGLFETPEAIPVTDSQIALLIEAGEHEWRDVEPAIFGTLLERALDPTERHKLGAHYTPRAYVERLVIPTIIEPLREQWANVHAAALTLAANGDLAGARKEVHGFLDLLCSLTILDPACGTGNFLYVSLEHLKRLEGEAWDVLRGFGEVQGVLPGTGHDIDPHQFKGIEINPRAAAIADLVLWIGYLQWNLRTFGRPPAEPIIHAFHNIDCRDAVLAYDGTEPLLGKQGIAVTRWDGITMRVHPVTGEEVPDDHAHLPVLKYVNPRKAEWPKADFVVGNPPFIGNKRMRLALGDGYVEALRKIWKNVPDTVDFVMYWWQHSAALLAAGALKAFGFITTNSITQTYNRTIVQKALDGSASLSFAIPDHPWVDTKDGAAVRVAMTVCVNEALPGRLLLLANENLETENEHVSFHTRIGVLLPNLTVGVDTQKATPLKSNSLLAFRGITLVGDGFLIPSKEEFGSSPVVRTLIGAQALMGRSKPRTVIDLYGLSEHAARELYPRQFQHLYNTVRPVREQQKRELYRKLWWIFAEPRSGFRKAVQGLRRYIATVETSKYRWFDFVDATALPEQTVIAVCLEDAYCFGILSSRPHRVWSREVGGRLGVGNDLRYSIDVCFDSFPFPHSDQLCNARIKELGEALHQHFKQALSTTGKLTVTEMYNVLARLRAGEALSVKERIIHKQGLVSVLKQIHDDLDAAVFDAYGWSHDPTDEEILTRLVDLNRERAAEEARGLIRWLRPEFQNPEGSKAPSATQAKLPMVTEEPEPVPTPSDGQASDKRPWPKTITEQTQAVRAGLAEVSGGLTPEALARLFVRAPASRVADLLGTLVVLGQARAVPGGRYVAS